MKYALLLFLTLPFISSAQFEGDWYSSFVVMGQPMQMGLTIAEGTKPTAHLKNPKQEGTIQCDVVTLTDSTLHFEWNARGLSYTGTLGSNGSINGTMQQSGIEWEAIFTRERTEMQEVKRPQEPKAPFSYTSIDYKIPNGDLELAATLVLPKNFDASTPIVILASGSGPQNRNCEIMGHEPFWVIADHFANAGIACLRFDDRGIEESSGDYTSASLFDFGSDVAACAKYLRKNLKYKKNIVGIAGHSEGGMHALIAAKRYSKIDFLIELASIGTTGAEALIEQQYLIPMAEGNSEEYALWNQKMYAEMSRIILNIDEENVQDSLQQFLGTHYDNAPEEFDKKTALRAQFIMGNMLFLNNAWGREFLAFDAEDYLKKLKLSILVVHGEKDIQVPAASNSKAFDEFENCEVHIVEGLNHLLQHCETCSLTEYAEIDETFSPEVLQLMSDWILKL